jgi:hypothetical protein
MFIIRTMQLNIIYASMPLLYYTHLVHTKNNVINISVRTNYIITGAHSILNALGLQITLLHRG